MKLTFFKKIKINFKPIIQTWIKLCGVAFSIVSVILIFVNWEDLGISNLWIKIAIFASLILLMLIISVLCIISLLKTNKIWANGNNKLLACYDDIFKISKKKEKKIVVIPVNDTLETIVDDTGDIMAPLVSKNTIHGKWINFLKNNNIGAQEIDEKIVRFLSKHDIHGEKIEKNRGKDISYPIGTVIPVVFNELPETTFYLLVISKFNEKNQAFSNSSLIKKSVDCLLDYYDQSGQGDILYIPLIGTGRSRVEMNHEESYRLLKATILTNEKKIHGTVIIVVYKNDKDKISIFK